MSIDKDYMLPVKWVCNTNCTFCNFYETKWKINDFQHLEDLKIEINSLDRKGISTINIWINWYEPTVFIYFFEILDFIKQKWFKIQLTTNWVKLADSEFTKKISNYIESVNITLYSSNDTEHWILTQNNDSYKLKLMAIKNCLDNSIFVKCSILLLKPALLNLTEIINQISLYFWNKYFVKEIKLISPSVCMWEERNKILIPSFTWIVKWVKELLKKYNNVFTNNQISLYLNSTIPRCLFTFNYDKNKLFFQEKQFKGNNKNIETSFDFKRIYLEKCNKCEYYSQCSWIEEEYIKLYWTSEIEKWEEFENIFSLEDIDCQLKNAIINYKNQWIWFNYEYLDKWLDEYKKIFILPKLLLWYRIKDVLLMNLKLKKIRFINDINNDSFIVEIDRAKVWNYLFSICNNNSNSNCVKIYNLIILFLHKSFNKK